MQYLTENNIEKSIENLVKNIDKLNLDISLYFLT